jgi:KUP system potassium uptake protein
VRDSERVLTERLSDNFRRMTLRFGFMEDPNVPRALEMAKFDLDQVSFFLSRRALQPSSQSGLPLWQDHIFITLARSASDVSDHFCIPEDRAVEVGARITI